MSERMILSGGGASGGSPTAPDSDSTYVACGGSPGLVEMVLTHQPTKAMVGTPPKPWFVAPVTPQSHGCNSPLYPDPTLTFHFLRPVSINICDRFPKTRGKRYKANGS